MEPWLLDVLTKAASAVVATAFGLFVVAEAKAMRIRKYLSDIETMLEALVQVSKMRPSQRTAETIFDHTMEHMADIEAEMRLDVKRGFRLAPALRREIKALREDIKGLQRDQYVKIVIKILYDRPEGAEYLEKIRGLIERSETLRTKIYFLRFLLP